MEGFCLPKIFFLSCISLMICASARVLPFIGEKISLGEIVCFVFPPCTFFSRAHQALPMP